MVILPQDCVTKFGSVGYLLPNLEARIVNEPDDASVHQHNDWDAAPGAPGELWIRGPSVMKVCLLSTITSTSLTRRSQGYLNNPKATQATITFDGWFRTGDMVTRDPEGFWFIVDRQKELIKYKVIFERSGVFHSNLRSPICRGSKVLIFVMCGSRLIFPVFFSGSSRTRIGSSHSSRHIRRCRDRDIF